MTVAVQRVPDLRRQVFDRLREDINAGSLGDDERLTEMTVAKRYEVSRTPAREALALLAHTGLLVPEGRGFRVPVFSRKDIDDMFEVRGLIEPYAAACIARDAGNGELKALLTFVIAEARHVTSSSAYAKANDRIRERMFSLLRNPKLHAAVSSFDDRLVFIRRQTLRDRETRDISAAGNVRLAQALAARDETGAAEAMRHLLAEAHRAIIALL
jgi:DNA-binding GntR family transcriptional regulator